jgi:hypothetical protein
MWCPGGILHISPHQLHKEIVFLLVGTNYRVGCFVLKSDPCGMIYFSFLQISPAHYLHLQGDSYNVIGGWHQPPPIMEATNAYNQS